MKISVFSKIFLVFTLFTFGLLSILFFVFYNFYYSYNINEDKKNSEFIINEQEKLFRTFIKKYDEKIVLIENIISNFKSEDEIVRFIKDVIFEDKTILSFKIVDLSAKESLKILNNSYHQSEVLEYSKLRNLFATNYFKYMRALNYKELYHYCLNDGKNSMNFIIRSKDNFYSIKITLDEIFENILNKYPKKIFIANTYNDYINSIIPKDFTKNEYIIKKIDIEKDSNFTFLVELNKEFRNDFVNNYIKIISSSTFILLSLLIFFFSLTISYLLNKRLNFNKAEFIKNENNILELNERDKIIDRYIMSMDIYPNKEIKDLSSSLAYFLGFSKNELVGHDYSLLFKKDMGQIVNFVKSKIELNSKTYIVEEFEGIKKSGENFFFKVYVEGIFKDLNLDYYSLICEDISDKKRVENLYLDLNIQVDEYDAIFQNVDSGVALLNKDGKFLKLNKKLCEILGYESRELLNLNSVDLISEESKNVFLKILSTLDDLGSISKIERIFIKKDKTPIHLELSLTLISYTNKIVFVLNQLEDKIKLQELNISLEQRIKQELEKSNAKDKIHLQEQIKNAKLSYIGAMAAGIVHEINTPLTYIKGNLELMQYDINNLPNDEIKDRMLYDSNKIKEGIIRLANIIESMREMSESTKEIKEVVNLYSTLITVLTMAYNKSKQISKIYINDKLFNIDNIDKNEYVFNSKVQKQRLEQVWVIILNNALDELIKIEDYEKRFINISIFEEDKNIVIRFKDNAGGIDEDIIDDIFDPFVSSKEQGGMGVGLNIAKKIVDEQNGEIIAFNEENGAVFEIRLKKSEEDLV